MILALSPKGQENFNGPVPIDIDESTQAGGVISSDVNTATLNYARTITEGTDAWTVCLPYNPPTANLAYYTLESVSGATLNFTQVTLPVANTPYLVVASANTNVGTALATEVDFSAAITNTGEIDGYVFKGTLRGLAHGASEGKYILQGNNKWGVVLAEKTSVYIPPFRAYIEKSSGGDARLLDTAFGDGTTPITNIRTINADGMEQWFDLNGRRIAQPTKKGLYIYNNKKVLRK